MKKVWTVFVASSLLIFCAGSRLSGRYDASSNTFSSLRYHCQIKLPAVPGWTVSNRTTPGSDIFFEATNSGRIIYVFLAAETLDSDLEDYYLLLKLSNKFDQRPGYSLIGKSSETLNGEQAIRFIYTAEIDNPEIGRRNFTYTNVLMRRKGINYRLIVYTLTDAYERKRDIIDEIVDGFRFLE